MELTIKEHLKQLRNIFLIVFGIFTITFFVLFASSQHLLVWLMDYYGVVAIALSPLESLAVQMKISLAIAFILVLPIILYGLYYFCKEFVVIKRVMLWLSASYALGLIGLVFGGTFFSKAILDSLLQMTFIDTLWSLESIMNLATSTSLLLAAAMQLWLIIPLLSKLGIVNYNQYKTKRLYILGILLAVVAFITPDPTMFSAVILTAPVAVSLEGGFMISRFQKGTTEKGTC